jgi:predicted ATPase
MVPSTPHIQTPDQRIRVFVSSTLKELSEERYVARRAISKLQMVPVMFEDGARPHPAQELYKAYIYQSHIFIGIYGEQYGWIAPDREISGLEEEYQLAADMPKLIYIRKPAPGRDPRLQKMLTGIRDTDRVSYKYFKSARELRRLVENDLALMVAERFESNQSYQLKTGEVEPLHNIPVPTSPLIGREQQLSHLEKLFNKDGYRLVTLTGPGGCGKTRLSIEFAKSVTSHYPFCWYVELANVSDDKLVVDTIANTLGIREAGSRSAGENLREFLKDKKVLLVLDNFEQVVSAAPQISDLMSYCPGLYILITSRMALSIRSENELPVPSLSLPERDFSGTLKSFRQYEAIALFEKRAKAIKPEFTLTEENCMAVRDICLRLDGLPLAIELAAARIRSLTPFQILERLQKRLPLLTGGARDLPERQKTMRKTIAWSYELLDEPEVQIFTALSVFSGGFSLDSAEFILGDLKNTHIPLIDLLQSLISKNLLVFKENSYKESRYEMLETIREFAVEKLSESPESDILFEKHALFFSELAEKTEPYLIGRDRDPWINRLETEMDNLRAVFNRVLENRVNADYGIRIIGRLGWFWHLRGHLSEGRHWAKTFLKYTGKSDINRARVLFPAGGLAWSQGDYAEANRLLEESVDLFRKAGDIQGLTHAQAILTGGLASLGHYEDALSLCEETTGLMRKSGNQWGLAFALLWHGAVYLIYTGDKNSAHHFFNESFQIASKLEDPWILGESLNHLATITGMRGEYQKASQYFEESLNYHRAMNDQWAMARDYSAYGDMLLQKGDSHNATRLFESAAELWKKIGNEKGLIACISGFIEIARQQSRYQKVARLYGAIGHPIRTLGYLFLPLSHDELEEQKSAASAEIDETAWNREYSEGQGLQLEEALNLAIEVAQNHS